MSANMSVSCNYKKNNKNIWYDKCNVYLQIQMNNYKIWFNAQIHGSLLSFNQNQMAQKSCFITFSGGL